MSYNLPLISKTDYIEFTSNWKKLPADTYLNNYFQIPKDGKSMPVYGVVFPVAAIKSLLSTEGLKKLKTRFCIKGDNFNIVLFGSDEEGIINSAYYLGEVTAELPKGNGTSGNVTPWLAADWIKNWQDFVDNPGNAITPAALFQTRYDILNGYTYDLLDFMHAMYDGVIVDMDHEYLYVHFALHQHHPEDSVSSKDILQTFNTVLQRVTIDSYGVMPIDNNPYYDISAPCPPTC